MENFSEEEKKEVLKNSLRLMKKGLLSGINFIQSDKPLPQISITVHYLHDSLKQLDLVIKEVEKLGVKERLILPRFSYYFMNPIYVEKENFLEEYKNAKFLDENLNQRDIKEVIKAPSNTIIDSNELDLLIPVEKENISDLVRRIQEADKL